MNIQKTATRQIEKHGKDRYPSINQQFIKLVEEVGELGKALNKGQDLKAVQELADVFLAAGELANKLHCDIEQVISDLVNNDPRTF